LQNAPDVWREITKSICLQSISKNAKQQVTWEVRGRLSPERRAPSRSKIIDVEAAQFCDLDVERATIRRWRPNRFTGHGD
jgi:hypothetical protein